MSIHIPCRPISVPKHGGFRRVFCRHQVLYNKQGKVPFSPPPLSTARQTGGGGSRGLWKQLLHSSAF